MMNLSKEQANLLLPLLRKLTNACLSEEESNCENLRPAELFCQDQPESAQVSFENKRLKYSAQDLYTIRKRSGKSSEAHMYCHVSI